MPRQGGHCRGYPDGLAGEAIPLPARVLCVADVFDALTTARPYRGAFPVAHALEIMRADSGRCFDPEIYNVFESWSPRRSSRFPLLPEARSQGGEGL